MAANNLAMGGFEPIDIQQPFHGEYHPQRMPKETGRFEHTQVMGRHHGCQFLQEATNMFV